MEGFGHALIVLCGVLALVVMIPVLAMFGALLYGIVSAF